MRHSIALAFAALTLVAGLAMAEPQVRVTVGESSVRVTLEGSYPNCTYTVWRSGERVGVYSPVTSQDVLCTGDCFATDLEALPGRTYYYRFDLVTPAGDRLTYGPYAVAIPDHPLAARLAPNPGGGAGLVTFSVPGGAREGPVPAEARLFDLQGRSVRLLHRGPIARGVTRLAWDGRGDDGQRLEAGTYFLRFSTALGAVTTRIVRFR